MYVITLLFVACFVLIYALLIDKKSLMTGIKYGVIFGLAKGLTMGFGSYCYMPIPLMLAVSWFLAGLVEVAIAGAIVGAIIKRS